MKTIKCSAMKGTLTQFFTKLFAIVILAFIPLLFFILNGYDVTLAVLLFFAVIGLSIPLAIVPMRKYSAASVEITDKELKFFDKSNNPKFSIPVADIANAKPEPYPNIYGDRDLNTKLTIKTRKGDVFTIILPEEGSKAISELVGSSVMNEESLKKIPLYMHIIFWAAVILVPLFIVLAIVSPESLFKDEGDYVKFFIYIPILIGFMIYYFSLRKKIKQQ